MNISINWRFHCSCIIIGGWLTHSSSRLGPGIATAGARSTVECHILSVEVSNRNGHTPKGVVDERL